MHDIEIYAGADYEMYFTVKTVEGSPINLTGYTIEAQLRPFSQSADYIDFTITRNNATGKIKLALTSAKTAKIHWRSGVYDVYITDSDGAKKKVLCGSAKIIPAVTREE